MTCPFCGSEDTREKMNAVVCNACGKSFPKPAPPLLATAEGDEVRDTLRHRLMLERGIFGLRKAVVYTEGFNDGYSAGLRTSRAELMAEVERLELLCDGHRLEAAERKENERCLQGQIARLRDDCQHLKMLRDWDRALLRSAWGFVDAHDNVGQARAAIREALGERKE